MISLRDRSHLLPRILPLGGTASGLTPYGLEGLFEDVESSLGGLAGDGEGREEHQDVFFGGDKQAVFAASVGDLGGVGFVFDFDADGEASAVDGGLAFEAHLREPGEKVLAELSGVF